MRTFWLVTFMTTSTMAPAASAVTDVICHDRDTMMHRLERIHGAERQGRGMRGPDALIEVWTIPSTGEWTLVQSYANGRSCIVAMGENWEVLRGAPDPA